MDPDLRVDLAARAGHGGGVDASAQRHSHSPLVEKTDPDGVEKRLPDPADPLFLGEVADIEFDPRKTFRSCGSRREVEGEKRTRRDRTHVLKERFSVRKVLAVLEVLDHVRIGVGPEALHSQKRLVFGSEKKGSVGKGGEIERPRPYVIPCEREFSLLSVPESESEVPVDLVDSRGSLRHAEPEKDLVEKGRGVGVGGNRGTQLFRIENRSIACGDISSVVRDRGLPVPAPYSYRRMIGDCRDP